MRLSVILFILPVLLACNSSNKKIVMVPLEIRVAAFDTQLNKTNNGWMYKGIPFSGYMVQQEMNGKIVYELPIIAGKENGIAKGIYNTGEKLMERNFIDGKKEGLFKQWWPNGNCRYQFNYKNDLYDGKQYIFFADGKKRQIGNYRNGEMEGLQSIWNEEGKLISNYTYRNKKLYGVITVKNCMPNGH